MLPVARRSYFGREGLLPPTDGREIRWYAIGHIPGIQRWRIAGIHWGVENLAYSAILHLHGGEFRRIRFRRFNIRAEASAAFAEEARNWDLSPRLGERIFGWTFTHDLEARE